MRPNLSPFRKPHGFLAVFCTSLALGSLRETYQFPLSHGSRAAHDGLLALTLGYVVVWMSGASMEPARVDIQGGCKFVELWYRISAQVKTLFPLPDDTSVVDIRGHERASVDVVGTV